MKADLIIPEHRQLSNVYLILAFLFFILGCSVSRNQGLIIEKDTAKSTLRIKKGFRNLRALEDSSPLFSLSKTILKEIKDNDSSTYTVYDNLSMRIHSHPIEDSLYIILGSEAIPVKIDTQESTTGSSISESKSNILTADSTTVSVVTDYNQHEYMISKITYTLSPELIEKMRIWNIIKFRYYSGSSMITTQLKESETLWLKKMIAMK